MASSFEGRHALVTGGGSGIGAAIAERLSGAGARLSLLGRRSEPLETTAIRVGGAAFPCDVTDPARIASTFAEARHANGPIEMLIVNAGIGDSGPFASLGRDSWDRMIAVNLTAAFDCAEAALSDLLASEAGRLVFIASVAGLRGAPYAAHYAAAKHGVIGLMRSMAIEFAKTNLTVNAVCPGFVDTPMTGETVERVAQRTGRSGEQSRDAIAAMNASGRLVEPDAVAAMVVTLCRPESRDVNGAAIAIDGGTTA